MRQKSPSSNHSRWVISWVLAVGLLSGCSTIHYYGQAARGHWQLSRAKQDIDSLVVDPDTPDELKQRLNRIKDMRAFAIEHLGLPDSGSYTHYADLKRDVTLWMLSAAPELSLAPKTWCYPFVGCLSYRGYFHHRAAERAAARLSGRGYDVAIHPGLAYSTLGLADDPVLNTMLAYDDVRLAGVLFHELAHELIYLRGDTRFNESFASAVERLGRERWAWSRGLDPESAGLEREDALEQEFNALLGKTRAELEALFASDLEVAAKRRGKAEIYARLQRRYRDWKEHHQTDDFDHWFAGGGPNNAHLALLATYRSAVPAFLLLFAESGEDFPAFYAAVRELGAAPESERGRRLDALLAAASGEAE